MGTSSAVPDALRSYARGAEDLDRRLLGSADRLRMALDAFRFSYPDVGGGVPYVELKLQGLAQGNGDLDHWVGQVGDAFANADGKNGGHRPEGVVVAGDGVIRAKLRKEAKDWDLRLSMHGKRDEAWNQ